MVRAFVTRAQDWERLADAQVKRIRDLCGSGNQKIWRVIASSADNAADDFEETAFRLQFLPANTPSEVRAGLLDLAGHAVGAVKQYVRLLYALKRMREFGARQDMRDFLDLVERLHEEEHATDRAERTVFKGLMTGNSDVRLLNVAAAIAGSLEKVGDALLHSAREISDYALGESFWRLTTSKSSNAVHCRLLWAPRPIWAAKPLIFSSWRPRAFRCRPPLCCPLDGAGVGSATGPISRRWFRGRWKGSNTQAGLASASRAGRFWFPCAQARPFPCRECLTRC